MKTPWQSISPELPATSKAAMSVCLVAIIAGLAAFVSCGPKHYTDSEISSLMIGEWDYSTSFEKTEGEMQTQIQSQGTATFTKDGSHVSKGETLLTITLPEGSVTIEYGATVYGNWSISDHVLHSSRASEEIIAKNEISNRFINDERMLKLRAETPTQFITNFVRISPHEIEATRTDGTRITYLRSKAK